MTTAFKIVGSEHVAQSPVGNTFEDAADVALSLAPEAPTFCYSAEVVHSRAHSFLTGFPGEVAYAVKANSDPDVVLTLAACGIGTFDVASVEEMALVRSLVPPEEVMGFIEGRITGQIQPQHRDKFKQDVLAELDHLDISRMGGLGITREQLEAWLNRPR